MAAEGFARHDLVRAPVDMPSLPEKLPEDVAAAWAAAGRPLIVRRKAPSDGAEVPLGLPLPPAAGKRRIALALPERSLEPVSPPQILDCIDAAPPCWEPTLREVARIGTAHGIGPRPFGALLWQRLTGLAYLHDGSDLDLLWPCAGPVSPGLLADIAALDAGAPMRIDGEILLGAAGVQWRELAQAGPGATVLCKSGQGVEMRPSAAFRNPAAA